VLRAEADPGQWRPVIVPAQIDRVQPGELDALLALLTENQLPLDGLRDHLATTLVARQDGRIVGSAALEIYADGALLRSVAVAPALQRRHLGGALTEAAIRLAEERGMPAIYLLTTTADRYFPRFGFARITRAEVPATVRTSIEFTSACPSSAIVMRKTLGGDPEPAVT
jgi:amino-acid N-acetyltransferase